MPSAGSAMTQVSSSRPYAVYPPEVTNVEVLGYVLDVNKRGYSRDIGRSSTLGGQVFYQFGDTFCKDEKGDFCGIVCHTCASIPSLSDPTCSQYLEIAADGKVACFIPYSTSETQFESNGGQNHGRVTLWSFGGTAEDHPGCGAGWCWFEKGEIYDDGRCVPLGTGVVRVQLDETGKLCVTRTTETIFGPDEPRWGTFCTLVKEGYVYLWGHHQNDVMLGRVKVDLTLTKSAYEFWDGSAYVKDWTAARPVMHGLAQGEVYRSNLFCSSQGKDYVFIGVSNQATSKVLMSVAGQLEGPWQDWFEICAATGLNYPSGYRYCIYPHPWAFREEDGELMVTWCEPFPGGVIAAKIKFLMNADQSEMGLMTVQQERSDESDQLEETGQQSDVRRSRRTAAFDFMKKQLSSWRGY